MRWREVLLIVIAAIGIAGPTRSGGSHSGVVGVGPRPQAHSITTVTNQPPPPGAVAPPIRRASI